MPARTRAADDPADREENAVKYVLVVCTQNAGRSQMAQALFERHAPPDVRAESAGQQPRREGVWPNVVAAMREVGFDLTARRPKKLTVEMQLHADWAVTLACGATCPYVPTIVEDWDIPDPAGRPLDEVREIRDAIEVRVRDLVEDRLELIYSDRTAHRMRLERLLPALIEEFDEHYDAADIRAVADAVLLESADAPVRSFVLNLAHRKARELLRERHALTVGDRG
jgi:arsenate reductase